MAVKKSPKSAPRKKTNSKTPVNKSAFIRENPSLSVAELIAKAKKQGFELTPAFIYTLRSELRKKQAKASVKAVKTADSKVGNGRATGKASGSLEQTFVAAIIELGAAKAEELFKATLARVRAIGGK